jgi:hypothetical protein
MKILAKTFVKSFGVGAKRRMRPFTIASPRLPAHRIAL